MSDDFINFDFTKARQEREAAARAKKAADLVIFLTGPDLPSDIPCMHVDGCTKMRWKVPTDESVLCRDHTISVLEGHEKAPPLRRGLDYQSVARKIFLVDLDELTPKDDAS